MSARNSITPHSPASDIGNKLIENLTHDSQISTITHLFKLQQALAQIGISVATNSAAPQSTMATAVAMLRELDQASRGWWLEAFQKANELPNRPILEMERPQKTPPAAERQTVTSKAQIIISADPPGTPPLLPSESEEAKATKPQPADKEAKIYQSKPLEQYPLFSGQYKSVLDALKSLSPPIATRKTLLDGLGPLWVQSGRKDSSLVPTLNNLLKGTSLTRGDGQLTTAAKMMIVDLAKLRPEDAGVTPVGQKASDQADLDSAPTILATPEPTLPDHSLASEAPVAPPQQDETAAIAPENSYASGLHTTGANDPNDALLHDLRSSFSLVKAHLTSVQSIDGLWNLMPGDFRGTREGFISSLRELADSRQPYNLANNGRLKPVAALLSMGLAPSRPVGELWADCTRAVAAAQTKRQPQKQFAELMVHNSYNLIPENRRPVRNGVPVNLIFQTASEIRPLLLARLQGRDPAEKEKKVKAYLKLFNAEGELINDWNLTLPVVEVMEILHIPTNDVAPLVPSLRNDLVYSDMVREHFPNLAALMQRKELFTATALIIAWHKIALPAQRERLVECMNAPSPNLLRDDGLTGSVVEILAGALRVAPPDILSPRKLVYQEPTLPTHRGKGGDSVASRAWKHG